MKKIIATILAGIMCISAMGSCARDPELEPTYVQDRLPISFNPTTDVTAARGNRQATILNFMYQLVKGNYHEAFQYCNMPEGTLFDADSLQKAALAQKIGRADDVLFYKFNEGSGDKANKVSVEYDLVVSGASSTYRNDIYTIQNDDGYAIDLVAQGFVQAGSIKFKAPGYAPCYINGVLIDQDKFMGNDYIYTLSQGVPKTTADGGMTLTIKTNFGEDFNYDIGFMGTMSKSKNSINDKNYVSKYDVSWFRPQIPRLLREKAETYIQSIIPVLMDDILHGRSWESANIRKYMGDNSQVDAMHSAYYKYSNNFRNAGAEDNGKYYFYDAASYNYNLSDEQAEKKGYINYISDYNVMQLYVKYDYNYFYTKGTSNVEKNYQGTGGAVVSLSLDTNGEFYIYNLNDDAFKFGIG